MSSLFAYKINVQLKVENKWLHPATQYLEMDSSFKRWLYIENATKKPLDKSAKSKINFLITQQKDMLWVLKRTISMRWFFWAPKTSVKTDG